MSDQPANPKFFSVRWQFLSPFFVILLVIAMLGAFFLSRNLVGGIQISQDNLLLQSSRAVLDRSDELYQSQRLIALQTAFLDGLPQAVEALDVATLQPMLEAMLQTHNLDSMIVVDTAGIEVIGVQRVTMGAETRFTISTSADMSQSPLIAQALTPSADSASGFITTQQGLHLFTAVPIRLEDAPIGAVLVGLDGITALESLKGSAIAQLALYGGTGDLLLTTFTGDIAVSEFALDGVQYQQAVNATDSIPLRDIFLNNAPYNASYVPLRMGVDVVGVVGVFLADDAPFITETGKQISAMLISLMTGVVIVVGYIGISRFVGRVEAVSDTVDALARGEKIRTRMKARDEIGRLGQSLDQYADAVQVQQDALQTALRQKRRELTHLTAVISNLPQGVIVQDLDGRVLMMNDLARDLLGSQRAFRSSGIGDVAQFVPQVLGANLAPGLYALGDPQRVHIDERILSAQAGAILSADSQRLGTVILLRDMSEEVRAEQERAEALKRLSQEIQQPLANLGRMAGGQDSDMMRSFAREVTRQSVALQRMILELREMSDSNIAQIQRNQRPIRLETLLWAVANEWRQVAIANGLTLHVILQKQGEYVLGDEKRLRWALGNIVDNAIKYTPSGGDLTLEIQADGEDGVAHLRVRDNGVGIRKEDMPHIFTRFYRGTPMTASGEIIRVPGMGQGLATAQHIIEAHGGAIKVKSTVGVGTAIYMTLPLTVVEGMSIIETPISDGDTVALNVRLPEDVLRKPR
jgi:signal transduction histidine kinase